MCGICWTPCCRDCTITGRQLELRLSWIQTGKSSPAWLGISDTSKVFLNTSLPLPLSTPFTQPRLQCLTAVVDQLSSNQNDFLMAVLPEAVLGMKETNERARSLACDLVVKMGYAAHRCSQLSPQGACLELHADTGFMPQVESLEDKGLVASWCFQVVSPHN